MIVTRRPLAKILSVAFALLALNGWGQVVMAALGRSSDSATLVALQFAIGLAGAVTAWGGWRGATWTWLAAIAYGVVTATMLAALPFLLGLAAEERSGIWTGAGAVLLFSLACAWSFRSAAKRQAAPPPAAQVA